MCSKSKFEIMVRKMRECSNLLAQAGFLQGRVSVCNIPCEHIFPPNAGLGLEQYRDFFSIPILHDTVHSSYADHDEYPPLTVKVML